MRNRIKLAVCIPLAMLVLAGCGPFSGDDKGKLSLVEKQKTSLYLQDIEDFCRNRKVGVLYTDILVHAVNGLTATYRDKDSDAIYDFQGPKRSIRNVLRAEASKLSNCGKDGRGQAGRLERTLQGQ